MTYQHQLKTLRQISYPPGDDADAWYAAALDGVSWMKENARSDYVTLYANLGQSYVCAVLASHAALAEPAVDDLISAQVDTDRGWTIQHMWGGDSRRVYLEGPVSGAGMAGEAVPTRTIASLFD